MNFLKGKGPLQSKNYISIERLKPFSDRAKKSSGCPTFRSHTFNLKNKKMKVGRQEFLGSFMAASRGLYSGLLFFFLTFTDFRDLEA